MTSVTSTATGASNMPTAATPTQTASRRLNNEGGGLRATPNGTAPAGGSGRSAGGRGGGARRGRGGRAGGANISQSPMPPMTAPSRPDGGKKFGARLTEDTSRVQGAGNATEAEEKQAAAPDEEVAEAEVCFICASPVVHNAVSPCNHRTCHICALRLRALYKTKACAHCRVSPITPIPIHTDQY